MWPVQMNILSLARGKVKFTFSKRKTARVQRTETKPDSKNLPCSFSAVALVKCSALPVCCRWAESTTRETLSGAFFPSSDSANVSEFYRWLNVQWSKTNLFEVLEATVC